MTASSLDQQDIGGASQAELDSVANVGALDFRQESDPLWDPSWVDAMCRWEKEMTAGHVILVFCDSPSILGAEHCGKRLFDLQNEGCPSAGVYLVGQSQSSTAWLLPGTGSDFQQDCNFIDALALAKPTAMILGRKAGHCVLWIDGIAEPRIAMDLPLISDEGLTEERIIEELERFEKHCWGHQFRKKLWKEKLEWTPNEFAESIVQDELHTWLTASFRSFNTFPEVNLDIGRADLIMLSKFSNPDRAVLELKVAKAITSGGNKIKEDVEQQRILAGRTQARAYAIQFGASIRMLCVYDLRQNNTASFFIPIAAACEEEKTTFKTYRMVFGSAEGQKMLISSAKDQ